MEQLDWKPNTLSPIPLYKQIEDYIKEKIANGEWTIGTKLPSQRTLADAFKVNRSTIVTALDELAAQGLIEGKGRQGTRVINNTWGLLTSSAPLNWSSYVDTGMHYPNLPTIREINRAEFDPNIIRLGTGELSSELLPQEKTKHIMNILSRQYIPLGYEEPKGDILLREQLAKYLQTLGIQASPSTILVVSGGIQALQLISMGILQKGATILVEKPSYLYSLNIFQSAGMRLIGIPMDQDGIQPTLISKYKKQFHGSLLYTIPSFHNPTGTLMSHKRRKTLVETCNEIGLPIVEDGVYQDLWFVSPSSKPLKAYDRSGSVLYIGSMSKIISPGLRIGWIVGPEAVINRLADIKMQTDYGSSSLSQRVAAQWLLGGLYEEHLDYIRRQLQMRRDIALHALKTHFAHIATWNVPEGGFYIWLHINLKISMQELFYKALQEGILLNPGNLYDRHAEQHLRISYSYASLHDIEKGIEKLARIIQEIEQ
ncbi:aminotransferase-like domain-containing protein [Bacillus sp. BP-3]|uniref:aminotransferase-like domain-containing protein n=1 Tax=Bacillus sp. BP-3 TaxID=3022773 RepID=UPI00232E633C|nr:PLP-dependent aminotransferase family protein [Bacillus sp. BP-3]MDC2866829.1 PLP-dependent aminotransferase family protein [Bacillus sp. BP-3]